MKCFFTLMRLGRRVRRVARWVLIRLRRRLSASLWLLQAAKALASGDIAAFEEDHIINGGTVIELLSNKLLFELFSFTGL